MKTSLAHLPENKQQELQRVVDIIGEEVDLDMLILFGSYARGDWIEDLDSDTLQYRYQSDYDLMIVTETRKQATTFEQNSALIKKLSKTVHRTPISLGRWKKIINLHCVGYGFIFKACQAAHTHCM